MVRTSARAKLPALTSAQSLASLLKSARPNDRPPLYCLNQVGMHKRPEIELRAFAKTIETQPIATLGGHLPLDRPIEISDWP